ncbi:isochorismatase family cysteine hydrolase [Thalassobacillus devorans]|uniref:isochorismatase family cysteine hydrolase n=1 Tax=Thalassobacillus devorans TaxID=279813 RepID=UPI00048CD9A2|nr:isochorismatase family cysteine hydrolase [Thalassobacillus devorans]
MSAPEQSALIYIDVINDFQFTHGKELLNQTYRILPAMKNLKVYARANGIPIIYINDHYASWRADLQQIFQHCLNDDNQKLLEAIRPEEGDYFLIKPKHSGFYQSSLQSLLYELGVKRLILSGIAGNICVLFDAYMREYELWVPENAIASNDPNDNQYALTMMENVLKADVSPI